QDVPLVTVEAAIPRLSQSDGVGHGFPPLACGSADAHRLQSRRAAAARPCVEPLLALPTGLVLPEPAGPGVGRILRDPGGEPKPRWRATSCRSRHPVLGAADRAKTGHGA